MAINRRKFTRLTLLGATSFATTSSIFFPKPAESFPLVTLLLRGLTSRGVFGSLIRFTAGRVIRETLSGSFDPSEEELLTIQLADKDFVERWFSENKTELARAETRTIFWGQQRQDLWGPNVGFGFVQQYQGNLSTAKISGPTMAAIYVASEKLSQIGLSPSEITSSLLPVRSHYDDWCTWEGDSFTGASTNRDTCLQSYGTVLGEVISRYDLIQPSLGGYGNIQLIVEAGGQPRREINVQVKFT